MILIDGMPLTNGHAQRGIGHYVNGLLQSLEAYQDASQSQSLAVLTTGTSVQRAIPAVSTWRPKRPRSRFGWAINGLMQPYDFRNAQSARLYHATDPAGLCRPKGLAMLATAYDLIPLRFPADYLDRYPVDEKIGYRQMLKRYKKAEHIVAISNSTRQDFIETLGIDASKIEVIYPGIRLEDQSSEINAIECRLAEVIPEKFFLYVGALDTRKNVLSVMDAYAAVCGELQEDFLIVGKASEAEQLVLQAHIQKLGIARRVRRLQYVADTTLRELYRRATALVLMSRYEGFGLPVLEAMAKSCPVICTSAGALAEVAGDAAHLVALDDPEALAGALIDLSTRAGYGAALRQLGQARARQFELGEVGYQMASLYKRIFGLTLPGLKSRASLT